MKKYPTLICFLIALCVWLSTTGLSQYPGGSFQDADPLPEPLPGAAEDAAKTLYLPLVVRNSNIDLQIAALEPTQTIQTTNNDVPMVANRPTVLRIYTQTNTGGTVQNVRVALTATRNGATLSGSPLVVGPGAVSGTWSRSSITSSFNARLPQSWLSGTVNIQVRLDSNNAISENNESNNITSITLNFVTVPTLDIKVVPIIYNEPGGSSYPAANTDYLQPALMKLYPVANVTVSSRTAIGVNCDLSTDNCWDDLLDYITALKKTDNAPQGQIYFGVIPLDDGNQNTWFYGGTAGLGWVGQRNIQARAAIGLADALWMGIDGGLIAAHEVGHTLGRLHAPCGVSGDRSYPYSGGSIGNYGLDMDTLEIKSPNTYSDVMGYCNEQWVSDYTYKGLKTGLTDGIGAGPYRIAADRGLLIRGAINGDQSITLDPAYAISGYLDQAENDSEYAVEFLDGNSQVVERYPVNVLQASEPGIEVQRINSLVPLPAIPYATYRLVRSGVTLIESKPLMQPDALTQETPGITNEGNSIKISWGQSRTPAMVRYTVDNGQTWTTLALDQTGGSLEVPLEILPAGKIQFQIVLADSLGNNIDLDWEK